VTGSTALSALLWVHAFRHIALQIFSAQRFGFVPSDAVAAVIAWGDVVGACLALLALWLLRARSPLARVAVWLFALETVVDVLNAAVMGIREEAFASLASPSGNKPHLRVLGPRLR
jgi:hypothetical protein